MRSSIRLSASCTSGRTPSGIRKVGLVTRARVFQAAARDLKKSDPALAEVLRRYAVRHVGVVEKSVER
ncbi:MAG: hypothetical protein ACK5JI_08595 [Azonexus sp.]